MAAAGGVDIYCSATGKCLQELAGYGINELPIVAPWNGLSIEWPMEVPPNDVPNR